MVMHHFYCYFIKLAAIVRKVNTELHVRESSGASQCSAALAAPEGVLRIVTQPFEPSVHKVIQAAA